MSNDSAEKRQAFQHWVSSLRPGPVSSPGGDAEESGITSFDEQATLVRQLPKDVVRRLREREASRHLPVDQDSTAIFHPPPDLIARARRLVPPKKPERGETPSVPAEPLLTSHPTPVVAPPLSPEADMIAELPAAPLPMLDAVELADAVESEEPSPVTSSVRNPLVAPAADLAPQSRGASRIGWTIAILGMALIAASAWFLLPH
jgi:hypothetical protein